MMQNDALLVLLYFKGFVMRHVARSALKCTKSRHFKCFIYFLMLFWPFHSLSLIYVQSSFPSFFLFFFCCEFFSSSFFSLSLPSNERKHECEARRNMKNNSLEASSSSSLYEKNIIQILSHLYVFQTKTAINAFFTV